MVETGSVLSYRECQGLRMKDKDKTKEQLVRELGSCPRIDYLAHFLEKNLEVILKDMRL